MAAALNMSRDALAAEVCAALAARGVRAVLLKGASFAAWLYTDGTPRCYGDVDLLIDPEDGPVADEVLRSLGFAPLHSRQWAFERALHGRCWLREGVAVDLHRTIWGIGAAPRDAWAVLSSTTETLTVGGRAIPVLSPAARTMHVALHAAQHRGRQAKSLRDLALALERVDLHTWAAAAALAHRLGSVRAMAAGLRLDPHGKDVAVRLGLAKGHPDHTTVGMPEVRDGLAYLAQAPGMTMKVLLAADILFPPGPSMRGHYPLARKGWPGLAAAYVWRLFSFGGRSVACARAVALRRLRGGKA